MPTTYSKNKSHIYKWRQNNSDKYKECCKVNQKKYQCWKKIKMEFLNILLEN